MIDYSIIYAENIIVGIIHKDIWKWFVGEKEDWILDKVKFQSAFETIGYNFSNDDKAIDNNNLFDADFFLDSVDSTIASKNELSMLLGEKLPASSWDEIIEFCPSLYINFDRKILKSLYPESTKFEEFVPDEWIGTYENFLDEVPKEQKYWVINETDYFSKFFK